MKVLRSVMSEHSSRHVRILSKVFSVAAGRFIAFSTDKLAC